MMNILNNIETHLNEKSDVWTVTGVAGFIGSNLLEFLLKNNQRVIGIDNFMTGSRRNLELVSGIVGNDLFKNFSFHEIDIRDQERCEEVMEGSRYVLHQAALGSVPRSIKTPELTNSVNVDGFISILNVSKKIGVKRMVYASSSAVYGDSQTLPKVEQIIGKPLSPYAVSKFTNELYAETFSKCYSMSLVGLRYFNIFGPRQDPQGPYAAVIPLWINSILSQQPTYINGSGEISRDFTYVLNAVQANILGALHDTNMTSHEIYNVGAGNRTTLLELHQMISEALGVDYKPMYREYRPGDIHHSHADIDKIKRELGFRPTHNVAEGLNHTCETYRLACLV